MPTVPSVYTSGGLGCGFLTSPAIAPTSLQPSYVHMTPAMTGTSAAASVAGAGPGSKFADDPLSRTTGITTMAARAATLSAVSSPATPVDSVTPRALMNVSTNRRAIVMACSFQCVPSRAFTCDAKTTAIPAAASGLTTSMYDQPKTNATHRPYASRRKTYTPPDCGCIAASSA